MERQRYEKAWESAENCEKVQKGVKKTVSGTAQLGIRMPLMLSALHGSGGLLRVMGLGIAGMGTGPEFETRTNPYP